METIASVLSTLPHHSECGTFENPRSVPVWEARYGPRFPTELLTATILHLTLANVQNDGVEWGDVRARHINSSWAGFLRFAVDHRSA